MSEQSPANCRNRLRSEGKPYPKSGCAVCKTGGMTGCPYERAASESQVVPQGAVEAFFREYVHLTNVALNISASTVRQCIAAALPRIIPVKVETPRGIWRIDHSAGCPILVYENCSVIQDEQAYYIVGLIAAANPAQGDSSEAKEATEGATASARPRDVLPLPARSTPDSAALPRPYVPDEARRDVRRVLDAANALCGDETITLAWFLDSRIQDLGGHRPIELVEMGKADAVIAYLDSLHAGALG